MKPPALFLLLTACIPLPGTSSSKTSTPATSPPGTFPQTTYPTTTTSTTVWTNTTWTDTTPTQPSCAPEVSRLTYALCAETTSGLDDDALQGGGLLTEVGALGPWPGSAPTRFGSCYGWPQQVRLLDDQGDVWTIGWDLSGSLEDDAALAMLPGAELDFLLLRQQDGYENLDTVLLSDPSGPLLLVEPLQSLSVEQRGADIAFPEDSCAMLEDDANWDYMPVSFVDDAGEITLWPGETGQLGAWGWALGDWSLLDPCPSDWCGRHWWAAWRLP